MELELEGEPDFEASGDVEITLPNFMTMLPQDELDNARSAVHKDLLIIACGRRPNSPEILLFTANNRIFSLNALECGIQTGSVVPTMGGYVISIEDKIMSSAMSSRHALAMAKEIDLGLTPT